MRAWSRWIGVGAAAGIILALVPVVRGNVGIGALRKAASRAPGVALPSAELAGIDLMRVDVRPRRVTVPLRDGKLAELTLDPGLQRVATAELKRFRVPEGGVILMEPATGKIVTYASYVNGTPKFDVNTRADAPAASIFKIVTSAALVEKGGLSAKTEQCYHGGRSRVMADELLDDPRRDKWCATLGIALGRSLNVVFGRLAQKHLTPEDVTAMGGAFGFGAPVPFVVQNDVSKIDIPVDPLEFARASAGFWHTTLSPLAAALIAQTVANKGVTLEPRIVQAVFKDDEKLWEDTRGPTVLRRAIKPETAAEVGTMMEETVANGSAFKSFHDSRGKPYLPDIRVAGKTGTLIRQKDARFYTWFVGFAPADKPEIVVSTLVVNTPTWQIKAPELARNVLRAYFSKRGARGVTAP